MGFANDLGSRGADSASQRPRLDWPLSVGSGVAVGPCLSLPHGQANWAEVVQLYDALFALVGSPVVAINRALAIAELHGAGAALAAMPDAAADARLAEYQPYWATRAELLAKSGAQDEARKAYEMAIGLERDSCRSSFPAAAPVAVAALTFFIKNDSAKLVA